ncbi:hypothetical protein EON67_02045, partial [archaeon]
MDETQRLLAGGSAVRSGAFPDASRGSSQRVGVRLTDLMIRRVILGVLLATAVMPIIIYTPTDDTPTLALLSSLEHYYNCLLEATTLDAHARNVTHGWLPAPHLTVSTATDDAHGGAHISAVQVAWRDVTAFTSRTWLANSTESSGCTPVSVSVYTLSPTLVQASNMRFVAVNGTALPVRGQLTPLASVYNEERPADLLRIRSGSEFGILAWDECVHGAFVLSPLRVDGGDDEFWLPLSFTRRQRSSSGATLPAGGCVTLDAALVTVLYNLGAKTRTRVAALGAHVIDLRGIPHMNISAVQFAATAFERAPLTTSLGMQPVAGDNVFSLHGDAVVSYRAKHEATAAWGMGLTTLVVLALSLGAYLFSRDVRLIVLQPLEHMVTIVKRLSANPLAPMSELLVVDGGNGRSGSAAGRMQATLA